MERTGNPLYHSIVIVFCLLPILLGTTFVYLFGVDVPFWDEWVIVPLLEKFTSGTLSFADLFSLHNEHRLFFPRLLILFQVLVTHHYHSVFFMYIVQFGLLVSLLTIYFSAKNQFHFTLKTLPIWFAPIPFLLFSWRQWENMLWGFQISFIMPLTFSLLSFFCLQRLMNLPRFVKSHKPTLYFLGALLCATIASYSFLMGLLVWIVGLFQIVILKTSRLKRLYLCFWGLIGIAEWIVYFVGFPKSGHSTLSVMLSHSVACIQYFLKLLGALAYDPYYALIYGVIFIILFITVVFFLLKQHTLHDNAFWLSLALYSLCTLLLITLGRSNFGLESTMWSRYTTYSIPFIVALYMLLISLTAQNRDACSFTLFGMLCALIILGVYTSYVKGWYDGESTRNYREETVFTLLNYQTASSEDLNQLYPSAEFVKQHAPFLEKQGYNVFHIKVMKSIYPDEYSYRYLKGKVFQKIEQNSILIQGQWRQWGNLSFQSEKSLPDDLLVEYSLSSWVNSDADTGILTSTPYPLSTPLLLVLYVMYGPNRRNQELGLDINHDGKIDVILHTRGKKPYVWERLCIDLSREVGQSVSIIASDNGKEWGQWMAISQPIFYLKKL